jgi:hypothetical protein
VLLHDCELFAYKCWTDVIVQGHVVAPGERPTTSLLASVQIGEQRKDVLVYGDRVIERGRFGAPEPFVRLPLCWSRAYGGVDPSFAAPSLIGELLRRVGPEVHPGAYPRNPVGAGWSTNYDPAARRSKVLPNFEDPRRPLETDGLIITPPRLWSFAAEPQGFGWIHASWYPRSAFLGLLPHEPALDDELVMPEVEAGWIPRGFSHAADRWGPRTGTDVRFANGAAAGLRMRVRGGELLGLAGFMGEGEVVLWLPEPPGPVRLCLGGRELEVEIALHTLSIEPDERRLTLLWAARARLDEGDFLRWTDVTARLDGAAILHCPGAIA